MSCVVKSVESHHFIALNYFLLLPLISFLSVSELFPIFFLNVMWTGVAFEFICVYFTSYIMPNLYNHIKWHLALLSLRIWVHLFFLIMSPPMEAPVQRITRCSRLILGRVTLGALASKTKGWRTRQTPSSSSTTSPTPPCFRILN